MSQHAGTTTNSDSGTAAGESLPTFQAASLSAAAADRSFQSRCRNGSVEHIRESRWFRGKARTIRRTRGARPAAAARDAGRGDVDRRPCLVRRRRTRGVRVAAGIRRGNARNASSSRPSPTVHSRARPGGDRGAASSTTRAEARSWRICCSSCSCGSETPGERGTIKARPTEALTSRVAIDATAPRASRPGSSPTPRSSSATSSRSSSFASWRRERIRMWRSTTFLWDHGYRHVPEPLGSVRYEGRECSATLGIAQRFVSERRQRPGT